MSEQRFRSVSEPTVLPVRRIGPNKPGGEFDHVAPEEPLEIRLTFLDPGQGKNERCTESLSAAMRSPGDDIELVAGFLVTEGVIARQRDGRCNIYAGLWRIV